MKKFLFTLVALLMAGTAVADEYMFINDFEVKQDQLGTTIANVEVIAHLDYMINAFTLDLGMYDENGEFVSNTLPGGITISKVTTSMASNRVSYLNEDGEEDECRPSIGKAEGNTRMIGITSAMDVEYDYIDGVLTNCGAIKWKPGEFVMMKIDIDIPANFEGCDLVLRNGPSAGQDPRYPGGTYPNKGQVYYKVCHITVEQTTPPTPVVAPVPTFDWSDQSFTMEAVCEDHDVVLMIGDEVVENPYTVVQTYEDQEITFTAYTVANPDEDENSATVEMTVTVPAKQLTPSNKPSIVVTPGDERYTVEATGTGTVTLYLVDGSKAEVSVANPYYIDRPAYGEEPITMTFKASNLDVDPEGEIQYAIAWSDPQDVEVPAKEPSYYQTPDPVITVDVNNERQVVVITATGEGTVTLKVTGATGTVDEASGTETCYVEVPFGDAVDYVNAYATATATTTPAGYDGVIPGDATETMIEIPAKPVTPPQEKTQDPTVHVTSGNQTKTITCEPNANDPESVIYISIDGGVTFEVYTDPIVLGIGEYDIVVYAVAPNKAKSNDVELRVVVDENTQPDPTAVNELNGEKAVAGVRYFNMAGQEMQEVNGVTIVVTTYTDGTTSAVKVIK